MQLADRWRRAISPAPWREGNNILWNDAVFSAPMLAAHLSQTHATSRRGVTIDRKIAWMHRTLVYDCLTTILDLGCGLGLLTSRLAQHVH
jgi:hypothetical protein